LSAFVDEQIGSHAQPIVCMVGQSSASQTISSFSHSSNGPQYTALTYGFVGTNHNQCALQLSLSPLMEPCCTKTQLPAIDLIGTARFLGLFDDFKFSLKG
jgi:hypothetical protein